MTLPSKSELKMIADELRHVDQLQRMRRHVVRAHGRSMWQWMVGTDTLPHGRDREAAARQLVIIRRAALRNGCDPRTIWRMARGQ